MNTWLNLMMNASERKEVNLPDGGQLANDEQSTGL